MYCCIGEIAIRFGSVTWRRRISSNRAMLIPSPLIRAFLAGDRRPPAAPVGD
jgi:hypothetical protein